MKVRVFCIHFCGMKRGSDVYKKSPLKETQAKMVKKVCTGVGAFHFKKMGEKLQVYVTKIQK